MVMRGVGGFFGVAGQYFALMYLTVSDTVVITFLGPTISSWMAYLFLKERYTRLEAVCGMVALLGVVLVAKPTFIFGDPNHASSTPKSSSGGNRSLESLSPGLRLLGTCEALVSCFGTGLSTCAMRVIGFNAHPVITVSFFSLVTFIFSLTGVIVLRLPLQMPHTLMQWGLLTTVGIAGFVMQYLSTMGLQREKASRAMTMSYTQLIYTTILEYLIFHHLPSFLSLLGSAIIMGSVLVVIVYKTEEEPVPEIDDTELTIYEDSHSLISSDSDK
ncbi:hypothetical protein OGAPHI_004267 [Ogataea philodendri]|uniref:EamA domain-containing protein n=1 Tax=Ogataea philodendri TaxID=1378263 RepID=A0A9P8T4L5_9ASCO|nr:uncharacterized protein OGAPHI_004267 [Ogataea philodendri]KAH3666078.1 hypothetical protein OGAPHI_004267 [Ogataea philodendri]